MNCLFLNNPLFAAHVQTKTNKSLFFFSRNFLLTDLKKENNQLNMNKKKKAKRVICWKVTLFEMKCLCQFYFDAPALQNT